MDLEKFIDQLNKIGKPVKVNLSIEIGENNSQESVKEDTNPTGFKTD